jgi:hypothetical protein
VPNGGQGGQRLLWNIDETASAVLRVARLCFPWNVQVRSSGN